MVLQDVVFLPSQAGFPPHFIELCMTSGLPHVCKQGFGPSKGMLPVRQITQKILMAVNYCGCQ